MLGEPVWSRLIGELDMLPWDRRGAERLASDPPLWIRIANFYRENTEVLADLPPGRPVLWKIEHFGDDARHPVWGLPPAGYVRRLASLGHPVVAYTFSAWSRELLLRDVANLEHLSRLHVLPLAHRPSSPPQGPCLRGELDVGPGELLLVAGGLLTAEKGFDELVVAFLRGDLGSRTHLLCSVVLDSDEPTAADVAARWERMAGSASPRLHVRLGRYGGRGEMARVYAAADAVLVNSVSESWCRMVSEPMGAGTPVVVRRARCGSNHVAPGTVLVDGFTGLGEDGIRSAVEEARRRAPALARRVRDEQGVDVVRAAAAALLRRHTPPADRAELERCLDDPDQVAPLGTALTR